MAKGKEKEGKYRVERNGGSIFGRYKEVSGEEICFPWTGLGLSF